MIETLITNEVISVIFAVSILLLFSTTFGAIFKKYNLPSVVGEILGGIILGPTFLGALFPGIYNYLFFNFQEEGKVLNIFYWLGLILLMLVSGYDIKLSFNKKDLKLIASIFIGSCVIPFLAGFLIFPIFTNGFMGKSNNLSNFAVLFAISIAVTSIPVISKIFLDLNIINTKFAGAIIAASTFEDILEWVILSIVMGISSNNQNILRIILISLSTLFLLLTSLLLLPKILKKSEKLIKHHDKIVYLFCFTYIVASALLLDVNILYSSLIIGIVLRRSNVQLFGDSIRKIESISLAFFIPLYFSLVGLRIDFINYFHFGRFLLYFCISSLVTIISVIIVLLAFKVNKSLIISYAIATSAKGGPGIVLATLGFEYHIINLEFFTTLILVSILSSLLAGLFLKIRIKNKNIDFDQV